MARIRLITSAMFAADAAVLPLKMQKVLLLLAVGLIWLVTLTTVFHEKVSTRFLVAQGEHSASNSGGRAELRKGIAYAPASAPEPVQRAIWAANALTEKPYKPKGGRTTLWDTGYDGAGAVSMALHYAGILDRPMSPGELMSFGEPGPGEWITIYARHDEAFAVFAGIRFDTMGLVLGGHSHPQWHADMRPLRGFVARHVPGL